MADKNSNKEAERAILNGIKEAMAKPRIAKSARREEPRHAPRVPPEAEANGHAWTILPEP